MLNVERSLEDTKFWRGLSDEDKEEVVSEIVNRFSLLLSPYCSEEKAQEDYNKFKNWFERNKTSSPVYGNYFCYYHIDSNMDAKVKNSLSKREIWSDKEIMRSAIKYQFEKEKGRHDESRIFSAMCNSIGFRVVSNLSPSNIVNWIRKFSKTSKGDIFLDPCAGWGGRMLAANLLGLRYRAIEANKKLVDQLNSLAKKLNMDAIIVYGDSSNEKLYEDLLKEERASVALTSPPYYDKEIYSEDKYQSTTMHGCYESWKNRFLYKIWHLCSEYSETVIFNMNKRKDLEFPESKQISVKLNRKIETLHISNNADVPFCDKCNSYQYDIDEHNVNVHECGELTEESLRRLSHVNLKTDDEIASIYGTSESTIRNRRKKWGIETLSSIEKISIKAEQNGLKRLDKISNYELRLLCVEYGKCNIHEFFGCSQEFMLLEVKKRGINDVNKTHKTTISDEDFESLYIDEEKTDFEISKILEVTETAVREKRKKLGIKTYNQEERITQRAKRENKKNLYAMSKEDLESLYETFSMDDIGDMCACLKTAIKTVLLDHGIEITSKHERYDRKYPSELISIQRQVILGSLLGDGHAKKIPETQMAKTTCFKESHCIEQEDYLKWKYEILKPYSRGISYYTDIGKYGDELPGCKFHTCHHKVFYEFRENLYSKGHRDFNDCYIDEITPLSLAIWYMDDGTLKASTAEIANNFRNISGIIDALRKNGIYDFEVRMRKCEEKLYCYRLTDSFFELIKPHIVPCMRYKLPNKFI